MAIGMILAAAGASRRLGQPKQLLNWQGRTLLEHAVEVALAAQLGPVTVVLGSEAEACRAVLSHLPVRLVVNPNWQQGLGSSLALGCRIQLNVWPDSLPEHSPEHLSGLMILLCDQPEIDPADLRQLAAVQQQTAAPIVASRYAQTFGPPALFAPQWFQALTELKGEKGAKSIFAQEPDMAWVDCPHAARDIDTPADAKALLVCR